VGTGIGDNSSFLNEADWSGFQLVQAPEPSSLILLGTGLLAFGIIITLKKQ